MKPFHWLLRVEAGVCALSGLAALLAPEILLRLLSQTSVGSLVWWLDVVVMVRSAGWLLLGLACLNLLVSFMPGGSRAMARLMTVCRVVLGVVRWRILADAPPGIVWIGWLDLGLAAWTVVALLRAGSRGADDRPAAVPTRSTRIVRKVAVGVAVLFAAAGLALAWGVSQTGAGAQYASDEEHFKYAPLMKPLIPGIPLYLFEAIPETFPDKLPGGWSSLGLVIEPGHATPVGFAEQTTGFPSLTPNCALCHSTAYRKASGDAPRFVPGAPAESLDFHRLLRVFFDVAKDPRFTDGSLLARIRARHRMSDLEATTYGSAIIPATAAVVRMVERDFSWINHVPEAGPGRQDAGTVLKHTVLRLPLDGTVATSDFRPLWNQKAGYDLFHRWSGGGKRLEQENLLAAALFNGMQPWLLDHGSYGRMTNYLASLQPPAYPLPVSPQRVERGRSVFTQQCASCHQPGGSRYNDITPLQEIGTDGEYLAASTPELMSAMTGYDDPPFVFDQQQNSAGYLNSSLEGIWLRGPYLHNGSVPTVADLLEPPARRPVTYLRGGNVLDAQRLGFVTRPGSPGSRFLFNSRLRGNANGGHLYGIDLTTPDKQALIEFLKTL